MAKKNTIVSSPNVEDLDQLYTIFISQAGNEKASNSDFIGFISQESAERRIFLESYTNYEFVDMGSTIALKVSIKV